MNIAKKPMIRITKEEAQKLGQEKVTKIPHLTNVEAAKEAVKFRSKKTESDYEMKRAVILNFTRHSEPHNLIDVLSQEYKHIRLFRPIDEGLFVLGKTDKTKINPLVSNPIETSEKTKSQQIEEWLYKYFTTKRSNGVYPLDPMGDYYVILPQKDAQIALEILTALGAIKNIDWLIIWSIYNEQESQFEIAEVVSTKGIYQSWKKQVSEVSDITNRRRQNLLAELSQAEDKELFTNKLSEEDFNLIKYHIKKEAE
jgi:hypothetical protein